MILLDTHIWVKWVLDEKQLPESVQRQIIVIATARIHDCPLLTLDRKILDYSHVKLL